LELVGKTGIGLDRVEGTRCCQPTKEGENKETREGREERREGLILSDTSSKRVRLRLVNGRLNKTKQNKKQQNPDTENLCSLGVNKDSDLTKSCHAILTRLSDRTESASPQRGDGT